MVPSYAYALPEGGSNSAGSATISTAGKKTDIRQSTQKAIIDWRSFDVAPDERVEFHHPSSSSITLNRIKDTKPSVIDGQLTANGHVVLINPNGVVFGSGSKVDIGSLTATTSDIDDHDFMTGRMNFRHAGKADAVITNRGSITAGDAGLVNLVAPQVENHGVIVAKLGKVQMAATDTFTLDMAGDGLIQIAVTNEDARKLVRNTGTINANDGIVALTAGKARKLVDSILDHSGVIQASSMTRVGGKVILSSNQGRVAVTGKIDASGKTGGGTVLIGGDFQGKGDTPNAEQTFVGKTAQIKANATEHGNGGKIILWADDQTQFYGDIQAKGISKGGFAEVSGKNYLDFRGDTDLSGAELGMLLLDPNIIDIVAGVGNPAEFGDDTIAFAENPGATSTLGATTLQNRLSANANVILQANNAINVNSAVTSTGSGSLTLETGANGTISVNAALNTNTGNMTFIADQFIIGAALTTTGSLTIKPKTTSASIGLGGGTGLLNLTDAELAFLNPATTLVIGDSVAGTGDIDLDSWDVSAKTFSVELYGNDIDIGGYTFGTGNFLAYAKDNGADVGDLNISAGVTKTVAGTSSFTARADNNFSKGVSVSGSGTGRLNITYESDYDNNGNGTTFHSGATTASGANIIIPKAITLTGNSSFSGGSGGTVSFGSTVNGAFNLSIGSTNTVSFNGAWGNITPLSAVGLSVTNNILLPNITAASITGGSGGSGNITINTLNITGTGVVTLSTASGNVIVDGPITMNGGNLTLTSGAGAARSITINQSTSGAGNSTFNTDVMNIGASVSSNGSISIKPRTATTTIGLGGGGGTLNLTDAELAFLNAGTSLIIGDSAAGTGDIDLDSWDLSSKTYAVEIYGNDIDIGGLTIGTGNILAYGKNDGGDVADLTISAVISKAVAGLSNLIFRADNNISHNGSNITATGTGQLNLTLASDFENDGSGTISLGGVTYLTNGGTLNITKALTLTGNTTLTGGTAGSVVFGSTVNGGFDLTIGTTGSLTFNGAWGAVTPLDSVSISMPNDMSLTSITANDMTFNAGGDISTGGTLSGSSVLMTAGDDISLGHSISVTDMTFDADDDISTSGALSGSNVLMTTDGDISLGGTITTTGSGNSIVLVADGFTNTAGANALNPGPGRYLVYSDAPSTTSKGGLTGKNVYNATYAGNPPASISQTGNRFVFNFQPTLTFTADNVTLPNYDPGFNSFTYTLSGLLSDDLAADAFGGSPAYAKINNSPTTYTIDISQGTLSSLIGYGLSFVDGLLTMAAAPPTPTPPPSSPPTGQTQLPPSVEQQTQIPDVLISASESYDFMPTGYVSQDAGIRMVSAGLITIEEPVAETFELCAYNQIYCSY